MPEGNWIDKKRNKNENEMAVKIKIMNNWVHFCCEKCE